MGQRNSGYERKPADFYATPAWVTECLRPHIPDTSSLWEPACGDGAMAEVLARWQEEDFAWQVEQKGYSDNRIAASDLRGGHDFLRFEDSDHKGIITNPPFGLADEFIQHALKLTMPHKGFVAMLLRADFDHAKSRAHLFENHKAFAKKIALRKRIVWFVEANGKPKASPSENHAWYLWDWTHSGPPTIAYAPECEPLLDLMEAAE